MSFSINEHFFAFQGEGVHMGRSAFFVRVNGCPVKCLWCDSAQTWHKDYFDGQKHKNKTVAEILDAIGDDCPEFIVATGGEPALYDWTRLIEKSIYPVHIETSGGFKLKGQFDWVTVSPKTEKPPIKENYKKANEIKIIVEDTRSIMRWENELTEHCPDLPVWLHPEWGSRNDPKVLGIISDFVKNGYALNYRAGYQIHKLYKVDSLDERTVKPAPLGGNPLRGSAT